MTSAEQDALIEAYHETFREYPPYNMDEPDAWIERVAAVVESGVPMTEPDRDEGEIVC